MASTLKAEVTYVTYFNPANNYTVAKVRAEGEPGSLTVVGCLPQATPGEVLELTGRFVEHPRFGRQFEIESFRQSLPATLNGIRRYLASGLIKGVGKITAERLIKAFGADVLEILDKHPERLKRVEGIGTKKLAGIVESWEAQREVRDLMLFLQSHEVPPTHAVRIFKHYGRGAVAKLKENPYELAYEIRGVGFLTADRMALKLGFAPDSPQRLEAAVVFCLFTNSEQGHLFCPMGDLMEKVSRLLDGADFEDLERAVYALIESKRAVMEELPEQGIERAVYLMHHYRWERETAARLHALAEHPAPVEEAKVAKVLPDLEAREKLELSLEQRQAVFEGCANKVFIITGGPGTGKTTITRIMVRTLDELGLKIKLAAPTGRAAKRLSEATGYKASTIHRLLQYTPDGSFAYGEDQKLKCDVLVVDEVSMLDAQLCLNLLRALPLTCRLILIGDVNQLPSVGAGNVLGDMLDSQCLPSAVLTKIFRQAAESLIVVNAHRINEGQFPLRPDKPAPDTDFFWVEQEDPERVRSIILQLVTDRIPDMYGMDPMRDIQVLSPMHKGDVGTLALNTMLQDSLNPSTRQIKRGKHVFRIGDRVLQMRNNYDKEVFNGDLGWVEDLDLESGEVMVDFEGQMVSYETYELDELVPAYAVSVHKSQGSEYPAVILPVLSQHYLLLQRNLIYTALTRARKLAVLIGGRRAMNMGLARTTSHQRMTHLRYRLQEAFNEVTLFGNTP